MASEEIREGMKQARSSLPEAFQKHAGDSVVRHFRRLRYGISWLIYAPIQGEIPTQGLFAYAKKRQDRIYFPRIQNEQIHFHKVDAWKDLKQGPLCLEPSSYAEKWEFKTPSIVVVPGLAFSQLGDRLGFGKGYYDRFLANHRHLPRLGLAYDFQINLNSWAPRVGDQRMDFVLTPSAVWGSSRTLN